MMNENRDDIDEKFSQKLKQLLGKSQQNLDEYEREIRSWLTIKNLAGNFHYQTMKELSVENYEAFIKDLQKRFDLIEGKCSMLDAISCEERQECVQSLKLIHDKGYINHGLLFAQKKDGKLDVAYAIYTAKFEMTEKKVYTWWYFVPTGWKHEKETLTFNQTQTLVKWCELQFYNSIYKKFEN